MFASRALRFEAQDASIVQKLLQKLRAKGGNDIAGRCLPTLLVK
jgi:hypothetical protein